MADYLRDQFIRNVAIDESKLRQLGAVFAELRKQATEGMTDQKKAEFILSYTLRFDSQGHRFYDLEETIQCYRHADFVERVSIALETTESLRTNRAVGAFAELRLDVLNRDNCWVQVASDLRSATDAAFAAILEPLRTAKNRNGIVRSSFTRAIVQIVGVLLGFVISLWGAAKLSPFIAVDSAFPITLLFLFLIFGNLWTFVLPGILGGLDKLFPNVRFDREGKDKWRWLWRSLAGAAAWALFVIVGLKIFAYAAEALAPFFKAP
jgi:hypothetical protein